MFQLGRSFTRLSVLPGRETADAPSHVRVQLCLAVDLGRRAGGDVTVGSVADALVIEPSTASRLVGQGVRSGLVVTTPSPADRRRVLLGLTPAGDDLVAQARRYQRQVFDELTATWDPTDRETFALLFLSFSQDVARRADAERTGIA